MAEGGIAATIDGDLLKLAPRDVELTLRQAGRSVAVPGEPYGIWPMTAPESVLGYRSPFIGSPEETAREFAAEVLEWRGRRAAW